MIRVKTFAVINGIIGCMLLSSNSARPMMRSTSERRTNFVNNVQETNEIRALQSAATNAPQILRNPHARILSPEEEVDRYVENAEQSLTELRNIRMKLAVELATSQTRGEASKPSTSNGRTTVSNAIKMALQGIESEKLTYSALAEGRFDEAALLIKDASHQQLLAHSLIKHAGAHQIELIKDQRIQKSEKELAEYVHKHKSLPTASELKAVIYTLDKDYSKQLDASILENHQEAATLVEDQTASSRVMHQDASEVVEHQLTEPLLSDQGKASKGKAPIKCMMEKLYEFTDSPHKVILQQNYGLLATHSNLYEVKALANIKGGKRGKALEWMKKMMAARKEGHAIHEEYKQHGYGTIDLKDYHGFRYDELVHKLEKLKGVEPFNYHLSSKKLQGIMKRLEM